MIFWEKTGGISCGLRQVAIVLKFTWIHGVLYNNLHVDMVQGFIVTQIFKIGILICAVHMKAI